MYILHGTLEVIGLLTFLLICAILNITVLGYYTLRKLYRDGIKRDRIKNDKLQTKSYHKLPRL